MVLQLEFEFAKFFPRKKLTHFLEILIKGLKYHIKMIKMNKVVDIEEVYLYLVA